MQKTYMVLALAGCLSFPVYAEGGITAKQQSKYLARGGKTRHTGHGRMGN